MQFIILLQATFLLKVSNFYLEAIFSTFSFPYILMCSMFTSLHKGYRDPDDGGSTHLWNVSLLLRDYMSQYPENFQHQSEISLTFLKQNLLLFKM
jgi:hypothetical protein